MAAGKGEVEYCSESAPPLMRTTFTTCGPYKFISQTKQILEEIKEKKESLLENIALELRSTETSEFYDVIDSLPGNEDVFEVLRIKQLVRDSIQTADREIQGLIKQQLKNESEQNDFVPSETAAKESDMKSEILPSNSTLQNTSPSLLHLKQNSKNKSLKYFKRKPIFDSKKKSGHGLKGSHQPVSSSSNMVNQQSGNAPQIKKKSLISESCAPEEQNIETHHRLATSEVSIPRSVPLLQQYKSAISGNVSIRNLGISGGIGIFSDKNKYFPSAIPLGPPNRQKSVERTSDFLSATEVGHNDAPPNLTRRSNVAVVTIESHEVNQKNLTCQALPSISIEGKPKTLSFQRNNVKNILFQEELSERNGSPEHPGSSEERECASFTVNTTVGNEQQEEKDDFNLKHPLNNTDHCDSRPDSGILPQDKEPSGPQKTSESRSELEDDISRDILENLILDIVHEDLWSVCCEVRKNCLIPPSESNSSPQKEKEVFDAETQVQSSLIELVDQETQAAVEHPKLISECIQTMLSDEPAETVSTGIQVSQSLEEDEEIEPLPVANLVTVADVMVQTSLELKDESNTEHKSLPEPQNEISSANNDVVIDSNFSLPNVAAQQHAQDVKGFSGSSLLSQADSGEKPPDDTQPNSGVTVSSSHRTAVVKADEMASEHDVMQSDLDVLPQKEQRLNAVQKISDSEPSLSEKTSGLTISASTTISDTDFVEGLISEGECILQSHLRLLSLLGKEATIGKGNPKRNKEKDTAENSLSDGEIPVRNLNRLAGDHQNSSLSEGELPARNLNRLTDNQRNLPTITLTGHFEETVPVKLGAEKPSTSSNNTSNYYASSCSEGEIYPHCNESGRKAGLAQRTFSDRN